MNIHPVLEGFFRGAYPALFEEKIDWTTENARIDSNEQRRELALQTAGGDDE